MPEETNWEADLRLWRQAKDVKWEDTEKVRLLLEVAYAKACQAHDNGDYETAATLCACLVCLPNVLDIFHQHGCFFMMSKIKPAFAERAEKIFSYIEKEFAKGCPMVVDVMRHTFFRSCTRDTIDKWDEIKGIKQENSLVSAMKGMGITELEDEEGKLVALLKGLTV